MADDGYAAVCVAAAERLEVALRVAPHPVGWPLVRLLREAGESFVVYPDLPPSGLRGEALEFARVVVAAAEVDRISC